MTLFIVRIELHGGTFVDYETLHSAMDRQGFSRQIMANDRSVYHLPPAEYSFTGNATSDQVLAAAKAAATTVKPNPVVLVSETKNVTWFGLIRAA
jgi:hypothetical protein